MTRKPRLESALMSALQTAARHWQERSPRDLVYDGPAGFVIAHGQTVVVPGRRLTRVQPLPRRHCFGNAIILAVTHGFSYVEGYAMTDRSVGLMVQHAWNLDLDGKLIDATWASLPLARAAYRGVVFSVERADDATWNGDACVLDDWQRGWPLLRQPWTGENFAHPWPSSPRLEMLRSGTYDERLVRDMTREADDALSSRHRAGDPDATSAYNHHHPKDSR